MRGWNERATHGEEKGKGSWVAQDRGGKEKRAGVPDRENPFLINGNGDTAAEKKNSESGVRWKGRTLVIVDHSLDKTLEISPVRS